MFKTDISGIVEAFFPLKSSQWLLPVFEAVSNSIHAIDDAGGKGDITVRFERDRPPTLRPPTDGEPIYPVRNVIVSDTGIGFTDRNFESFCVGGSDYKRARGGKGVGRLSWLAVFQSVDIASSYFDSEGTVRKRDIRFSRQDAVASPPPTPSGDSRITAVGLRHLTTKYRARSAISLRNISQRMAEHFLLRFIRGRLPQITLVDDCEGEPILIDNLYTERSLLKVETFRIRGENVSLTHVRAKPSVERHPTLYFCVDDRTVQMEALVPLMPGLESRLRDETGEAFVYSAMVTSPILDESMTGDRQGFSLDSDDEDDILEGMPVGIGELRNAVIRQIGVHLQPFVEALRLEKRAAIQKFVNSNAPQYRPLLKHRPEVVDRLTASDLRDEESMDLALYKHDRLYEGDLRSELNHLLTNAQRDHYEDYRDHFEQWLVSWNEKNMGALARYVVHRRATIDYLDSVLRRDEQGYSKEDAVHDIFCPTRLTSDDIPRESMNLWILDERFAFHRWLYSDTRLSSQKNAIASTSNRRPDVSIFFEDTHVLSTDEQSSPIVLVEFKKPGRRHYQEGRDKNPIDQLEGLIEDIREESRLELPNGRPRHVASSVPIHAIALCDFDGSLLKLARKRSMSQTPNGEHLWKYHSDFGAFIELISYEQAVRSARQRNQVLFDKLGIASNSSASTSNDALQATGMAKESG